MTDWTPEAAEKVCDIVRDYASHQAWRCEHRDRWPWEPHCMCGLTNALEDAGLPMEWAEQAGISR